MAINHKDLVYWRPDNRENVHVNRMSSSALQNRSACLENLLHGNVTHVKYRPIQKYKQTTKKTIIENSSFIQLGSLSETNYVG